MGVTIKVDWYDLDQLARDLKGLPERISKEVQKAQEEDLKDVAKVLAHYPLQLPGTHYHRTGDLGRGWTGFGPKINILGGGLNFSAELTNNVPYAGAVQGGSGDSEHQTEEFKRRNWKTTDQALAETEDKAQKRLDEAVQRGLDKMQTGK
jgi:hypothetical protein